MTNFTTMTREETLTRVREIAQELVTLNVSFGRVRQWRCDLGTRISDSETRAQALSIFDEVTSVL